MAILDYSRTLNAAGQQTPLQGMIETRKGLQGLKANEMAMKQQQQKQEAQQAEMQRKQEARMQAAEFSNWTPDQIAEFGIMNPDVMKDLIAAANFIDEQAVNSRLNYAQNVLSGNVAPREAINERIQEIESRGGNADQLRVTAQGTDEQVVEAAKIDFSVIDPQGYKSYMGATGQGGSSTTDIDNWKKYQKLLKIDPEGAKQFGQQAGFVTPEGKELSVHLQKRLSNAADDASKSDLNIGKYKTLISDIEGANIKGGVIEGSWKEYFKDVTGNQDFTTDLRRQYAAIRGSQLVDNLPPGAASDKDIELALAGFPTDNATGEQLTSFLNGLIKLEGHKRDLNEFKANYISEKGTEKGMLKEWRKMQKERIKNPKVIKWGDI